MLLKAQVTRRNRLSLAPEALTVNKMKDDATFCPADDAALLKILGLPDFL